ncbi:putative copper uptake transporter [Papiliotrema laurentii]|uniref:Copper transport protein n=1 Tax=Papiliotrema laurentii TaxID=5418 RepID=A0AAD9FS44_PAPLA|nr:putative copper uptake transporter [Papiliotrema laurentii]
MDMGNDHSSMAGMGSSAAAGPACKISMLWNWNTVDSCFIAKSWHVRSKGGFAGSVLGVFFLCIAIEALRRGMREYDRWIVRRALASSPLSSAQTGVEANKDGGDDTPGAAPSLSATSPCGPVKYTPGWFQHLNRSLAYGSQFTASFLVMLLGMYYNGYILFAIFLGHSVGYMAFGRDTCGALVPEGTGSGHCC